jgi:hypothetical protein
LRDRKGKRVGEGAGGQGGEMAQTMYAYMNKEKINRRRRNVVPKNLTQQFVGYFAQSIVLQAF